MNRFCSILRFVAFIWAAALLGVCIFFLLQWILKDFCGIYHYNLLQHWGLIYISTVLAECICFFIRRVLKKLYDLRKK